MQKFKISILTVLTGFCLLAATYGATFNASSAAEIQNAFNAAASNAENDTINISSGVYDLTVTLVFVSTEQYSITIQGAGKDQTILDGGGDVQVMDIDTSQTSIDYGTTVTVTGITFQNGYFTILDEGTGGAGLEIKTKKAEVIIEDAGFLSNESTILNPDTWASYDEVGGGGLFVKIGHRNISNGENLTLQNCLFKDNRSTIGGGAYIVVRSLYIPQSYISNNIFDSNMATDEGGGLWVATNILYLNNNTFLGNECEENGGGLYIYTGYRNEIYNNIIWGNSAAGQGGDFYNRISNNYLNIFHNTYADKFLGGDGTYSEVGTLNEDPHIGDSYKLEEQSKSIDSGYDDAPHLPATDYHGNERIHNGQVDRGAVEKDSVTAGNNPDPGENPIDPITGGSSGGGAGGCFIETASSGIDENSEGYKAAKRCAEKHAGKKTQQMLEKYKKKLTSLVTRQKAELYQKAAQRRESANEIGQEEILIFISGSIPPGLIRSFVRDANKLECDVKFILRCYPDKGISSLVDTKNNQPGKDNYKFDLNINPLLFSAYGVEQVPEMVVNRKIKVTRPESIKTALIKAATATEGDYSGMVKALSY